MKRFAVDQKIFSAIIFILLSATFVCAQDAPGTPSIGALRLEFTLLESMANDRREAPSVVGDSFWTDSLLSARDKQQLMPLAEEQKKYETFLKQSDTGLCRLLAVDLKTVSTEKGATESRVLPIRGGGAHYSFLKKRHIADEWAQLQLFKGYIGASYLELRKPVMASSLTEAPRTMTVGTGLSFFTALGNLPLEQITLETNGVNYLRQFQPATRHEDYLKQARQFITGVRIAEFDYGAGIQAKADMTYVMRSIIYNKADVIIALRIVRQDEDGSVHILWKQLQSLPAPKLKK